jgi:prepilin signal peptidase PulO-like enzyme (type II secretory pathway)
VSFLPELTFFLFGLGFASLVWAVTSASRHHPSGADRPVCEHCERELSPASWLPLYGFGLALKCRSCGRFQPAARLVWELAVGGYFVLLWQQFEDSREALWALLSAVPLLFIFAADVRRHILYMNSIYLSFAIALTLGVIDGPRATGSVLLGLTAGVAISTAYFALSRWVFRSMRFRLTSVSIGDLYVSAAAGALVRADGILPAFAIGAVMALLASVTLPLLTERLRGRVMAFAPFLCLGSLITLLR